MKKNVYKKIESIKRFKKYIYIYEVHVYINNTNTVLIH